MKKYIKVGIISFILGAIIFGSIGVFANNILASSITYKNTTVEAALDELYTKTPSKICELKDGTANTVGAKYECDPGDGVKRNFYILTVNNNTVDLIMDRNITQGTNTPTMTWNNAMKYIDDNNLKNSWSYVLNIDLPKAQAIADAVGNSNWRAEDNNAWWCFGNYGQDSQVAPFCESSSLTDYIWLYDYTIDCNGCRNSANNTSAYGYWTRDAIVGDNINSLKVWSVYSYGLLSNGEATYSNDRGVRLVITVLKSQLSN